MVITKDEFNQIKNIEHLLKLEVKSDNLTMQTCGVGLSNAQLSTFDDDLGWKIIHAIEDSRDTLIALRLHIDVNMRGVFIKDNYLTPYTHKSLLSTVHQLLLLGRKGIDKKTTFAEL